MEQFQIRDGTQTHFDLFTLRHSFRKFPGGKRKESSFVQLEGVKHILETGPIFSIHKMF